MKIIKGVMEKLNFKKPKTVISAIVVILLIMGLSFIFLHDNNSSGYVFKTTSIKNGSISNIVTATGTLEATNTVVVGTQVSGVIENIYVDFNSKVKKGQLLAELDDSTLRSSLENAEADLDYAKAELDYQAANFNRVEELFTAELLSESDYELANYNYKKSEAGLKSAQANLNKAERNLSYAMIYSPIDGIVLNREVEQGQTVASSMSTPELFTIVNDLTTMQVEANVDEADIGQLELGQRVEFSVDAFFDITFNGEVSEIRLQPNESSNVITYTVIITVSNPELKLKPGMTATVTIYVEEANNVLVVSELATSFTPNQQMVDNYMSQFSTEQQTLPIDKTINLTKKSTSEHPREMQELDDSHAVVWVKNNDNIYPIVIEVGVNDGSNIEVVSGLDEGTLVITSFEFANSSDAAKSSTDDDQVSPFIQERPKKSAGGGPGRPPR